MPLVRKKVTQLDCLDPIKYFTAGHVDIKIKHLCKTTKGQKHRFFSTAL